MESVLLSYFTAASTAGSEEKTQVVPARVRVSDSRSVKSQTPASGGFRERLRAARPRRDEHAPGPGAHARLSRRLPSLGAPSGHGEAGCDPERRGPGAPEALVSARVPMRHRQLGAGAGGAGRGTRGSAGRTGLTRGGCGGAEGPPAAGCG